jgi:hypothetical protein
MKKTPLQASSDKIYARQIAFSAAFLLPAAKFLETPSILAANARGDLLLPALLHTLVQALVLLAVLYAASKSEIPLLERLKTRLGKGIFVVYALYAAYFFFAAVLPLLDLEKFVYAAFFDTAPTTFSFAVFFFFSAYVCAKSLKSIARSCDICLFLFLFPFLALVAMSLSNADFSSLMPLFGTSFSHSAAAFRRTIPHFLDAVLLLPLIANLRYEKGDGVKIMSGYTAGAACTLLLLAVFYGLFGSLSGRTHYAFSKIAQFFPALSIVGRIDLIFVYLLSVVLVFYTCLPLQYTTEFLCEIFRFQRKTYLSAVFNFLLLIGVLFLNRHYDRIYALISGDLNFIFLIFGIVLPLFLLFLPSTPTPKPQKKEKPHA